MPAHAEDSAPGSIDRLTAMGLVARPTGWVPDQPPEVTAVPTRVDGVRATSPADASLPPLPSRLDLARLAVADKLPSGLGDRMRETSASTLLAGIVAVVAVATSVGLVVRDHNRQPTSYSDSYSSPSASDAAPAPATDGSIGDGSSIVVDVGGDVRHPGLVTLPVGARVDDAIRAAGGPVRPRELARTNLAARVTDGELLVIGRKAGRGGADSSGGLVALSSASLTKLETLPGVGPVTAQKIVDWRNAHGGFTSVEQLQQVPGIGPTRYAELSPLVAP